MLATYGAGRLYAVRTDVSPATPYEFGVLQDVSFDVQFQTKPIYGSNIYALFVARGQAKIMGKASIGEISGSALNALFFGNTITTGQVALAAAEASTIPGTPYQITVANAANFVADYGVRYSATGNQTGLPLTKVASGPTTGQYSVAAGVYTFAAADTTLGVSISYTYTVSATGQKITIAQTLAGQTPYFSAVFRNRDPRTGLFDTLLLNRVTASKLSLASKNADYTIPALEFEAFDDGTGNIGYLSVGDAS